MDRTQPYRAQHREIIGLAGSLTGSLDPERLTGDPEPIHAALLDLAAKLRAHLRLEDHELYPELLRHGKGPVRELAAAYQAEMGRIHGEFEALVTRWETAEALRMDPYGFSVELLSALDVLHRRIHLEDRELYPLVDRLDAGGAEA